MPASIHPHPEGSDEWAFLRAAAASEIGRYPWPGAVANNIAPAAGPPSRAIYGNAAARTAKPRMGDAATAATMPPMVSTVEQRAQVVVAGGGIAGVEAALALRAFAGSAARVRLVDPALSFRVPSTATGRIFGAGAGIAHPMADVAERAGAELLRGRLAAVDPRRHLAMLAGGRLLTYDALIVAVGARSERSVRDALTFAGHDDADSVRGMVEEMVEAAARGGGNRLAIVIPAGCSWPLAAYELALMAGEHLTSAGVGTAVDVAVVTAEEDPLGVFGAEASASVQRMLGRVGVAVVTGTSVRDWRWGRLELTGGGTLAADRVIALPVLRGPFVDGLPSDADGFVRTEGDGSVPGAPDVWAVGDGTTFPVKQGGVACQQADSTAAAIARRFGTATEDVPFQAMLRGWVWDDAGATFQRASPADGRAGGPDGADDTPLWWPVPKVSGRFLAPFLQDWATGSSPARRASSIGLTR